MSLRAKLLAIVLFVGIVPLAISSATGLRVHQRAYDGRVLEERREDARHGADLVRQELEHYARSVGLLSQQVVRWDSLADEERSGALWLVYRQLDEIAAAALLDADGKPIAPVVFRDPARADPEIEAHPAATKELLELLPSRAPKADAGPAIGKPFSAAGIAWPLVPITVPVRGAGGARWRVVAAVSLSSVCASASGTRRMIVGPDGEPLCGVPGKIDLPALRAIAADGAGHVGGDDGVLAGSAALPGGWRVFSVEPVATAWKSSRRIRGQSLLWLGIGGAIALLSGVLLARGITGPVARLEAGAKELAAGNLAHRLDVESKDELGRLAGTFNQMSGEIAKRDAEIRAWNAELQQRVEQRTAELRNTQELLFQSQKIAAVSSLGAGIAHEMFSPLTGILGLTQVLIARGKRVGVDVKDLERLEDIQREALRLQTTVETLRAIAESAVGEGMERAKAATLLDEAVRPFETALSEAGIDVSRQLADGLEVFCDRRQIVDALGKIIDNARIAMTGRPGGKLGLVCFPIEDGRLVRMVVNDSGRGIAEEHLSKVFDPFFTTKDAFRGEGLGLTFAFRAVQRHHGTIEVSSKVGRGTSVTITLPTAAGAHLV